MPLKIVLFYNQTNRGWTETWYAPGSTIPFALDPADLGVFKNAIAFRAPLTELYAVRYSLTDSSRKSNLFVFNGQFTSPLGSGSLPDVVSTDASWLIVGADDARRQISLRGVPDDAVARDVFGIDRPTPGFTAGVERYLAAVFNRNWTIRIADTPKNSLIVPNPVISMQGTAGIGNGTSVTCKDVLAPQLVKGKAIRFTGSPRADLAGFPRTAVIASIDPVDPKTFVFKYRWRGPAVYNPLNTDVLPLSYQYKAIQNYRFLRFSERKTGRPFGSLRGRSRAVARAS